jgi:hypothetical protein
MREDDRQRLLAYGLDWRSLFIWMFIFVAFSLLLGTLLLLP